MNENNGNLIIINALLWDGTGQEPKPDQFIEIREGLIVHVDGMDKISAPKDLPVLDAEGRFVMPGLIDCHVHLVYCCFENIMEVDAWPIEYHTLRAAQNAATLLSYGYTSVRDVGSRGAIGPSLRDAIHQRLIHGPRIVACGPMICSTAGYADSKLAKLNTVNNLHWPVSGVDEIISAVRTQIRLGVDCIKVFVSASEANAYANTVQTWLSPEEFNALMGETRRFNKMVACHAQSYLGARMAVEACVTTIEHGTRLDNVTIKMLAQADDTYLIPTLCTIYSVLERSRNKKQIDEMKVNQPLWIESLHKAHKAGVKIAAGSDNGNRYLHGEEAKELELMVRHGFTESEALIAATRTASQALHLADRIGTVEKGKFGDLILLNANPLSDIKLLQNRKQIFRVVKAGEVLDPRNLAAEVL